MEDDTKKEKEGVEEIGSNEATQAAEEPAEEINEDEYEYVGTYEDGTETQAEEKRKYKKTAAWRGNKKVRLAIIAALIIIAGVIAFMFEKVRLFMIGIIILLVAAFGLEATENDLDLGKLIETGSIAESKVKRDGNGNLMLNLVCSEEKYNCNDFSSQLEAQEVFEACGFAENDVHGLDGNKDGIACQSLN